jgi:hypothetical protein
MLERTPDEVDDGRIMQAEDFDGNGVELEFTERYIGELNEDLAYEKVLHTEREFLEYRSLISKNTN